MLLISLPTELGRDRARRHGRRQLRGAGARAAPPGAGPTLAAGGAPGQLRLGADERGRAVRLAEAQLAAHGLIVGASGAGKSTTLLGILRGQIMRGQPVVVIDLKGSPQFARALASGGSAGRAAVRELDARRR